MRSAEAWLIYILVVIVTFLLLTFITFTSTLSTPLRVLISFLVGAFVIFIMSPSIVAKTDTDKTWYGILVIVAILIPLIIGIWLIFSNRCRNLIENGCVIEKTVECDKDTGVCEVVGVTEHCPAQPGLAEMVNQFGVSPRGQSEKSIFDKYVPSERNVYSRRSRY